MSVVSDPFGSTKLKLSWEPNPLPSIKGDRVTGRHELFEDWVEAFVANTGGWPAGPYFQTPEELDLQFYRPGWDYALRKYASPLSAEDEYADEARFVEARRLIRALRRSISRISYYIDTNSLPRPYTMFLGQLVWKFDDIANLLLLAERIKDVFTNNNFVRERMETHTVVFIPSDGMSDREYRKQFIQANIDNLSDAQLAKIQRLIFEGPKAEEEVLPAEAPRLWRDRTSAERINGKGFVSPAMFIISVWGYWLKQGLLSEDDLAARDPEIMIAYKNWLYTHKRDKIEMLKPGLTKLQKRVYSITPQTPWCEVERIALAVSKQRQRGRTPAP